MAVPAWGIAFICLSIVLCCVGACLFYYGYQAGKEAEDERADIEQQRAANRYPATAQSWRHPAHSPAQQLYTDATYTPQTASPPVRQSVAGPVASVQPSRNNVVRTETSQIREITNVATVAEEQARLEREIQRLENEQYAMDNKWEGTVTVVVITGERHEIPFVSTDKISELKAKLYDLTTIIPQRISLAFGGTILTPDNYMLGAFRTPASPTLHMMIKMEKDDAPLPVPEDPTYGAPTNAVAKPAVQVERPMGEDGKPINSDMDFGEMAQAALAYRKQQGEDVSAEEQRMADAAAARKAAAWGNPEAGEEGGEAEGAVPEPPAPEAAQAAPEAADGTANPAPSKTSHKRDRRTKSKSPRTSAG